MKMWETDRNLNCS